MTYTSYNAYKGKTVGVIERLVHLFRIQEFLSSKLGHRLVMIVNVLFSSVPPCKRWTWFIKTVRVFPFPSKWVYLQFIDHSHRQYTIYAVEKRR